jgi:hypothetical protein
VVASANPSLAFTNTRTPSSEEPTIVPGRLKGGLSAGIRVAATLAGGAEPAASAALRSEAEAIPTAAELAATTTRTANAGFTL